MDTELTALTIYEAVDFILRGKISPVELTRAHLERIQSLDAKLDSFITVTADLAMQRARQVEQALGRRGPRRGSSAGLLTAIPVALKDLYETRGVRTTCGSSFFADYVPRLDAAVVDKLTAAGAVLIGKTNMHEIALGVTNVNPHFGACRNPWNQSRISGGSSGGSAVALAAGFCMGAFGSDTGGSIRIPASLCGIVGIKPTRGRVSLRGVMPLSWNLDHAGPMARCVKDVAILLQVVQGYDPLDPYSVKSSQKDFLAKIDQGIHGWKVALVEDEYFSRTAPEVQRAVQEAAKIFEQLGARVSIVPFPGAHQAAVANGLMVVADAAVVHYGRLKNQPDGFGADVLERLRTGLDCSTGDYIQARRTQATMRRQFEMFFKKFDILLTPATPVAAPPLVGMDAVEQARLLTRYTAPFNLTGLPALSLPCGFTSEELPVGLQIVSRPWAEDKILRAAYAYEQATPWHRRTPVL